MKNNFSLFFLWTALQPSQQRFEWKQQKRLAGSWQTKERFLVYPVYQK
jgi:hypothetical protein